jgi:hypothetical protein
MSLKAIHMLSIVRKDTAMKSFNFVCTSVRSTSPKRFWSFIKAKKQENTGVAPLRGNDGMLHSASNNKAEILNAQFKSAYTKEDLTNLPHSEGCL